MTMVAERPAAPSIPLYDLQGDYMLVSMPEAKAKTAGGVILPDDGVIRAPEGTVLDVGPGILAQNGVLAVPQVERGDRILTCWEHMHPAGVEDRSFRIVSDAALVAYSHRGGPFQPAGNWCMLIPDPRKVLDKESGMEVLCERPGGILIAAHSHGVGGTGQEKRRGSELYAEMERIGRSRSYLEAPDEYERHRVVHKFLDGLSKEELRWLGDAIEADGDTRWRNHYGMSMPKRPISGVLIGIGPGAVRLSDGERRQTLGDEVLGKRVFIERDHNAWISQLDGSWYVFVDGTHICAAVGDD